MKTRQEKCVFILIALLSLMGTSNAQQTSSSANLTSGPAVATENSHDITGDWQGMVGKQHLGLKIEGSNGSFSGKLIVVDQGNMALPADTVSFSATTGLRFELKKLGVVYEAKLSDDGAELAGTWYQGGNSIPLAFHRPGAAARFTLKPRTMGSISLEPCRNSDGNVEGLCGKYEVYENRETQRGRKIALSIMVLPAFTEKALADAFFGLAGGPGQSAIEAYPLAGYVSKLREQRDVVLVDQRGTGKSNLMQCALQSLDNAQDVLGEPYSAEKIRACRAESDQKGDTKQYTTSIAADDLDEVRQAMGYDKINVFGGSYGTKAALVYLRMHGDHVRTLTLEAVASPQYLIPLPFARGLQSSIQGVIDLCNSDPACHRDYPKFGDEFAAIVERLRKSPAQFKVNNQAVTLSEEMFLSKLRPLLYVPQFVSAFPLMIHMAYEGNWLPYAQTVLALAGLLEGVVARGASFAAICAEDVPGLKEDVIRQQTEGTYQGDSQVRRYQKYCEAWGPAGAVPANFYTPVHSKVPTLLISGELDPATPPETARQAAKELANSRVVVVRQGTHGTGSPCVDTLITNFVRQGSVDGLDASCVDQIHLPPFQGIPPAASGQ